MLHVLYLYIVLFWLQVGVPELMCNRIYFCDYFQCSTIYFFCFCWDIYFCTYLYIWNGGVAIEKVVYVSWLDQGCSSEYFGFGGIILYFGLCSRAWCFWYFCFGSVIDEFRNMLGKKKRRKKKRIGWDVPLVPLYPKYKYWMQDVYSYLVLIGHMFF